MSYNGEKKFNWQKGDVKFQLPQCSECERNTGPNECEIYGEKPDMFVMNEEECSFKVAPTDSQ